MITLAQVQKTTGVSMQAVPFDSAWC